MSESNLCRLCVNLCYEYLSIYDASGRRTNVYDITVKYFHPMFLNVEQTGAEDNHLTVLCLKCWNYIFDFYNFQESILLTQTRLLEGNKEISSSSKELTDINNSINEHSIDPNCFENDGLESLVLPDIELMDVYSDMPSDSVHASETLDSKDDFINPIPKYTEESLKKSSDYDDDDDNCDDDDPIGYFTAGNFNNANTDNIACSPIKIECSSSEEDEMQDGDIEELSSGDDINPSTNVDHQQETFKESEENINPNFSNKPNNSMTSATGGEVRWKRTRKTTTELDSFIAHWKPQLECTICHHLEPSFSRLQYHFRLSHSSDDCHIRCCDLKLKTRCIIEKHIRSHHRTKTAVLNKKVTRNLDFKSTLCLDRFIEHYEGYLKCGICDEEKINFGQLEKHFLQCHPREECHILCCRRRLKNRYHIKEHICVHLNRSLFQCKLCQMCQVTKGGLISHMMQRHGVELKDVSANIKAISANALSERHNFKQLDTFIAGWRAQLECHVCSESCPTFTLLQAHFQQMHPEGPECYIKCCGSKLRQHHQVEDHILLHQDPMAFKCQLCNECFLTRPSLYNHSRLQHPLLNDNDDVQISTSKVIHRKSLDTMDTLIAQLKPQLPCDLCQASVPSFKLLQQHFRLKHPSYGFYIVCCERKFHSRFQFLNHQKQIHDGTPMRQYEFKPRKNRMELDDLIAQWRPNLTCVICQNLYPTFTQLKDHFAEDHPNQECHIVCCQKKLKRRCDIKTHIDQCYHTVPNNGEGKKNCQ